MNRTGKIPFKQALVIVSGILIIILSDHLGFFIKFDYACNDLFFRLRGATEPDRRILIVAVDEKTLKRLGQWPLKRSHYTRLLATLNRADAIGFDILMAEPTRDDVSLSMAAGKHRAVIFPSYIERSAGALDSSPAISTRLTGHVHLEQDIDGIVRRVYHTISVNNTSVPSFSSAIYEAVTGRRFRTGKTPGGGTRGTIRQADGNIINYFGPPGTFPHLSMVDVLDCRYRPDLFTHRIILIGATAEGLESGVLTPFSEERRRMNGVEAHANILNNLLNGNGIMELPNPFRWLVSALLALLGLLFFIRAGNRWLLAGWITGMAGAATGAFFLFSRFEFWFSPVMICLLLTFMLITAHLFRLEQAGEELQAAQEEWEESFNTINDAIILMDCEGRTLRANTAGMQLPKPLLDALSAKCREPADTGANPASPGNGALRTDEIPDPDSERCYETKSLLRSGCRGEKAGFVHVVRDVSERKKAEAEKENIRIQLLQSQKMESVGRMAAGITHDFNNILTAILGFSELAMIRMHPEDPVRNHIQIIHESGLKAARLTRQLLAFSRREEMHLQRVNLPRLINDLSKILTRMIGEDVTLNLETEQPTSWVNADPSHLEQVIMNLAVNARDAMPSGGTLTLATSDVYLDRNYSRSHFGVAPGHYVVLRVTDTGIGMSKEVQAKIFDPFFTTKKPGEGTGLGLSTVYGIIRQLSGHIHVYSEVGKGSVFNIYLPACEAEDRKTGEPGAPEARHGSESVLVAEDDVMVRQLIADSLEPLGYRVSLAGSYAEALNLMQTGNPGFDILLTDVIMPESGGKELAQAFRKRYPSAGVLFMSGYTEETIARHGLDPGRISFIQKPLVPARLAAKLREVLDGTADDAEGRGRS